MPYEMQLNRSLGGVKAEWPAQLPCRIALVGEAPGAEEAIEGRPFVGASGRLLNDLLGQAAIDRAACLVTNVFTVRPPENNVGWFFGGFRGEGLHRAAPAYGKHGWLKQEWAYELDRLKEEITRAAPNVVVALGATPLWALCGAEGISKYRGAALASTLVKGVKVLPTYHPAYVMRQWAERPTVGMDLIKARRESDYPEIRRPNRAIWIEPTLGDLAEFERRYMQDMAALTYDIETDPWDTMLIRCVGLAPDESHAIVVPFTDWRAKDGSYWKTEAQELVAWEWLAKWLSHPSLPKVAQNGLYDIQWLARFGIKVRGPTEDTMLLHHVLQPELPKSLGHLGSIYTDEASWKTMVSWKSKTNKKDAE